MLRSRSVTSAAMASTKSIRKRAAPSESAPSAEEHATRKRKRTKVAESEGESEDDDPNTSAGQLHTLSSYRKALLREHGRLKYKDPPVLPPHKIKIFKPATQRPKRAADGSFTFEGAPHFHPNRSPSEILQAGAFGGTYFRSIYSVVTGKHYNGADVMGEFPKEWFKGLSTRKLSNQKYDERINKYGKKCGGDLEMWESSGWISDADPYGWFQWYCRFFEGRRCSDDKRQLDRAHRSFSPTGRWRLNLFNKIIKANAEYDDPSVSPVIRQTLLHWGYEPTKEDFETYRSKKRLG